MVRLCIRVVRWSVMSLCFLGSLVCIASLLQSESRGRNFRSSALGEHQVFLAVFHDCLEVTLTREMAYGFHPTDEARALANLPDVYWGPSPYFTYDRRSLVDHGLISLIVANTIRMKSWPLLVIFSICLVLGIITHPAIRRARRRRRGQCINCGYNLTGLTSDKCPECGTAIGTQSHRRQSAHSRHACEPGATTNAH